MTVLVDYAHNAVSMESLLATLRNYHPKRLVCVFGCGGNRSKDRRYSMGEIGGRMADLCILTADNSTVREAGGYYRGYPFQPEKQPGAASWKYRTAGRPSRTAFCTLSPGI